MASAILTQFLSTEYLIPLFLVTIFIASLISSKIKIPYTMVLVGVGIAISLSHFIGFNFANIAQFKVDPKLILVFIVPPLIFEAMMKIKHEEFKQIQISSLLLSTVGVLLATLVGGFLLVYFAGLPYIVSFAFAALIAPTDAAIVIEVFKKVRVPKLLSTLLESEASFNDATGVIIFSSIIAIAVAQGSTLGTTEANAGINVNIIDELEHFALVFFGGIAVGLAISAAAHRLHKLLDDPFSETALSVAVMFGSVVVANSLGMSGLIAAAVAGLYFGNITMRSEKIISPKVRTYTSNFWEMLAFFANSLAFLYLGLSMDLIRIGQNLPLIILAFVVVLAARAVSTYPILRLTNKFTKENIPRTWRNVVWIGGMRGALSVALVATLPESEFKEILQTITFGVVLASLIIQYPVLARYIKKAFPETIAEEKS
ncbi:sodium:proton antiporter [Candidatus Pacearchaeota archaeon]|nr:sodium:proton antiporter [Candidatus Pacearchaeota archaeon]